jgi:hypothetical protein
MKRFAISSFKAGRALLGFALAATIPYPAYSQPDMSTGNSSGPGKPEINIVLYEGPLAHDQHWLIKSGTSNPDVWGGAGGTCSLVATDVKNVSAMEKISFEAKHDGLGIWKMAWIDTVVGTASAVGGSTSFKYSYYVRTSFVGTTTDGRAPDPSRARPNSPDMAFLNPIPHNVITDGAQLQDQFLLTDPATNRLVADAQLLFTFGVHRGEPLPSIFPFELQGLFVTNHLSISGSFGCDPL